MSIRFRASSTSLSASALGAIRHECELSISELRGRASKSEWLFEIPIFAGDWPDSKPRLVRLLQQIESGALSLVVSEYFENTGKDEPLSIAEAFDRLEVFRDIAIEQDRLSQLEAGYISKAEEYIPPDENGA